MAKKKESRQDRERRLAGTRQAKSDAVQEAARMKHEAEKRRVLERARELVRGGRERRDGLGVNREAALGGAHQRGGPQVNNTVPRPSKPGRGRQKTLPPMSPGMDPGAPE